MVTRPVTNEWYNRDSSDNGLLTSNTFQMLPSQVAHQQIGLLAQDRQRQMTPSAGRHHSLAYPSNTYAHAYNAHSPFGTTGSPTPPNSAPSATQPHPSTSFGPHFYSGYSGPYNHHHNYLAMPMAGYDAVHHAQTLHGSQAAAVSSPVQVEDQSLFYPHMNAGGSHKEYALRSKADVGKTAQNNEDSEGLDQPQERVCDSESMEQDIDEDIDADTDANYIASPSPTEDNSRNLDSPQYINTSTAQLGKSTLSRKKMKLAKKRQTDDNPENRRIFDMRTIDLLEWSEIARRMDKEYKLPRHATWSHAAVYGRFVRVGPVLCNRRGMKWNRQDWMHMRKDEDGKHVSMRKVRARANGNTDQDRDSSMATPDLSVIFGVDVTDTVAHDMAKESFTTNDDDMLKEVYAKLMQQLWSATAAELQKRTKKGFEKKTCAMRLKMLMEQETGA